MSNLNPDTLDIISFKNELETHFGNKYSIETNKEIINSFRFFRESFDLVIYQNNKPIVAIEYKSLVFKLSFYHLQSSFVDKFQKIGIKFGLIYFGDGNEIWFYRNGLSGLERCSLQEALYEITSKNYSKSVIPTVDEIKTNIKNVNSKHHNLLSEKSIDILFSENSILFNKERHTISFTQDIEDYFFKSLLPEITEKTFCRYTSIDSLFLLLKEKKICMCSITCMNDKGELYYPDSYINCGNYSSSDKMISDNNNCFILSCCKPNKKDDLTMWRLYANNGTGTCLEYEIDYSKIDDKTFFFAPVSYGEENGHSALEVVKSIMEWEKNGWQIELKRWHIWKHFFKSHIFSDEQEVRLLYIPDNNDNNSLQWIMDSTNHIASRISMFKINNPLFPLTPIAALIGPKCQELISNVEQFNFMNSVKKVFPEKNNGKPIMASTIKDYR